MSWFAFQNADIDGIVSLQEIMVEETGDESAIKRNLMMPLSK